MRKRGSLAHFNRSVPLDDALKAISSFPINLSQFERIGHLHKPGNVEAFRRIVDGLEIVIKSYPPVIHDQNNDSIREVEKLTHITHRCIVKLVGIIIPSEFTPLRIATSYARCGSLQDVLKNAPAWWTPTAKLITIAGIVLGMRYLHRLGFVHGNLKSSNILFDDDHVVQISDFGSSRLVSLGKSVDDEITNAIDVFAFGIIFAEILICRAIVARSVSLDGVELVFADTGEPVFLAGLLSDSYRFVKSCLSPVPQERFSFDVILEWLRREAWQIIDGVDAAEVFGFVSAVEVSEGKVLRSRSKQASAKVQKSPVVRHSATVPQRECLLSSHLPRLRSVIPRPPLGVTNPQPVHRPLPPIRPQATESSGQGQRSIQGVPPEGHSQDRQRPF
jgi:serine/threonine protein kinase